jgi:CMP-2-keto-3-deoxyoctulosonic acid synthetase
VINAGTVRCHEAVTKLPGEYDVVINIQGDEPLIEPQIIDDCVRALQNSPNSVYRHAISILAALLDSMEVNKSDVKVAGGFTQLQSHLRPLKPKLKILCAVLPAHRWNTSMWSSAHE